MSKSTKSRATGNPDKPRPDFPLYACATGRWAKHVRGKIHYFGNVASDSNGQEAPDNWPDQ